MIVRKEYQIIDQQVREWIERNKKSKTHDNKQQIPPVITISREWGVGSHEVALKLRERLGADWRIWDKQIIGEIAQRADVRNEVVRSVEEGKQTQFEIFFRSIFGSDYLSHDEYRRHVASILIAIGHHGKAIILGRGANFILPRSFRVRLVGSRKYRIEHIQEKNRFTEEEALAVMRQSDHEKSQFVKQVYNEDINSPWHYDLCVKVNYIKTETIAEMILRGTEDKLGKLS